MIHLSAAAVNEIKRLQQTNQTPNSRLRIAVKPGGCSDLYYVLDFTSQPDASDRLYESQGITIVIDPKSHAVLQGLTLDYSEDLMGGGFRFHNPNAVKNCGCGHSFTLAS
jgi:iron-sulfur cluster assembly protein